MIFFIRAYVSYVRPILEYSSQVWSPSYMSNIDKIEKVQRYLTRRLFSRLNLPESSYHDELQYLCLESLELRRLHFDLTMVYKY